MGGFVGMANLEGPNGRHAPSESVANWIFGCCCWIFSEQILKAYFCFDVHFHRRPLRRLWVIILNNLWSTNIKHARFPAQRLESIAERDRELLSAALSFLNIPLFSPLFCLYVDQPGTCQWSLRCVLVIHWYISRRPSPILDWVDSFESYHLFWIWWIPLKSLAQRRWWGGLAANRDRGLTANWDVTRQHRYCLIIVQDFIMYVMDNVWVIVNSILLLLEHSQWKN